MGPRFKIKKTLGAGSFGAVYLAEVVGGELQREVAIKMLHAEHATRPRLVAKLRDEARILSMVRHRSIVQVQDLVEAEGGWAIVMEYVPGVDLATALELGPLPPRAALEVVEEAASALHAAASQSDRQGQPLGLVHRDVKPANIRVTPAGEVKLLDFGVAHAEFAGKEAATFAAGVGTWPYMAPERFMGDDTSAGDVYALGVTLFEMLVGVVPGNEAGSPERVFPGRELRREWLSIERVSRELVALLVAMLAPVSTNRPSAREVARRCRELSGVVGGLPLADWAEQNVAASVPSVRADPVEARVGTFLVTGASALGEPAARAPDASPPLPREASPATWAPPLNEPAHEPNEAPRSSRSLWVVLGVGGVGFLAVVALFLGAGTWLGYRAWAEPAAVAAEGPVLQEKIPNKTPERAVPPPAAGPPTAPTSTRAAAAPAPIAVVSVERPAPTEPIIAPGQPGEPRASAAPGRVVLSGDSVDAALFDGERAITGLSPPPGAYSARVRFEDDTTITVPRVDVRLGEVTELRCNARFKTCATLGR